MIGILIACALLAQQAAPPPSQVPPPRQAPVNPRVQGRVTNSSTGDAVPKVTIILRAKDEEHGQSYADQTDSNGRFTISDVEPGEYAVIAQRPGFMPQSTGATGAPPPSVQVERNQPVPDITIRLTPLGVITGRILDADGDPLRHAMVQAYVHAYSAGKREMRTVEQVQSGDNGEFRLFGLQPGEFYLKATIFTHAFSQAPSILTSYYPNASDDAHAQPVVLRAGTQLSGVDIRIQPSNVYTIHFQLPGERPLQGAIGAFLVNEKEIQQTNGVMLSDKGVTISGVAPGSYELILDMMLNDETVYARQHVDVANSDVDGGTLTFLPPVNVAGKVRVEGAAPGGLSKFRIHLEPQLQYPVPGNHDFPVGADGSFSITGVMPAVYDIGINREAGLYVKAVSAGDKVLANRSVDLASKTEPLVVVIGADAGEVEGAVHNAKGDPVPRARVNVIAYGAQASRTDFNRFGFTDEKGDFKIKDVPPGEYKVFAWEDVPVGAPQDPEFRKPFEKQAVALTMQPNGHEKVQVTVISADQVARSSQ